MKILKKNHFVYEIPEDINSLLVLLAKEKIIYFAPLDRIMPTAFFKGVSWEIRSMREYLSNDGFRRCERKDAVSRRRIKEILKEIPVPA